MDQNGKLANLKQSIKSASLVKSIGDLKVGTVIYVEMDENIVGWIALTPNRLR